MCPAYRANPLIRQVEPQSQRRYRTGQYWVIPRLGTPEIVNARDRGGDVEDQVPHRPQTCQSLLVGATSPQQPPSGQVHWNSSRAKVLAPNTGRAPNWQVRGHDSTEPGSTGRLQGPQGSWPHRQRPLLSEPLDARPNRSERRTTLLGDSILPATQGH